MTSHQDAVTQIEHRLRRLYQAEAEQAEVTFNVHRISQDAAVAESPNTTTTDVLNGSGRTRQMGGPKVRAKRHVIAYVAAAMVVVVAAGLVVGVRSRSIEVTVDDTTEPGIVIKGYRVTKESVLTLDEEGLVDIGADPDYTILKFPDTTQPTNARTYRSGFITPVLTAHGIFALRVPPNSQTQRLGLVRIDLTTGELSTVLEDVGQFIASSDGSQIFAELGDRPDTPNGKSSLRFATIDVATGAVSDPINWPGQSSGGLWVRLLGFTSGRVALGSSGGRDDPHSGFWEWDFQHDPVRLDISAETMVVAGPGRRYLSSPFGDDRSLTLETFDDAGHAVANTTRALDAHEEPMSQSSSAFNPWDGRIAVLTVADTGHLSLFDSDGGPIATRILPIADGDAYAEIMWTSPTTFAIVDSGAEVWRCTDALECVDLGQIVGYPSDVIPAFGTWIVKINPDAKPSN